MSASRDVGCWLADRTVPQQEKIDFCWTNLRAAMAGKPPDIEIIGKCACHLAYRKIEGNESIDLNELVTAVKWAQLHCEDQTVSSALMRTRWYGSITIALAYLTICSGDLTKASELCAGMYSLRSVREHPQNCLNIMRALLLRAAYKFRIKDDKQAAITCVQACQTIFKGAIETLTFEQKSPSLGDEMQRWITALKISIALGHLCGLKHLNEPLPLATVIVLEKQQPFFDAFIAMCGGLESILPPAKELPPPQTREELARMFEGVGVELGVAGGAFSATILRESRCTRLYSIDRWNDHHTLQQCKDASERLARAGKGRCVVLRASFEEALPLFKDESLDFITIDGYAHTGQEGGKTLADWWPKLKKGGIYSGHDYHRSWPATVQAVDAFAKANGFQFQTTQEQPPKGFPTWWVRKA